MEQLANIFSHVIKFRFWYISVVSCLALLANWYMMNDALGTARKDRTGKIEGKVRDIKGVLDYSTAVGEGVDPVKVHPNETTEKGMKAEIGKAVAQLIEAWKLRRQAQEKILVWPKEIIGSDRFVEKFSQYDPPEKFPTITSNSEIDGYCLLYFQQIQKRMDGICDLIRSEWPFVTSSESDSALPPAAASQTPAPTAMPGPGTQGVGGGQDEGRGGQETGGAGEPPATPATPKKELQLAKAVTVTWDQNNQLVWYSKLRDFRGRDGSRTDYPTGYQVLALQQDLWLLEAMFKVIADVNGETLANDLAKIEQIHHVFFGREARAQLGKIMVPDARLSGGVAAGPVIEPAGPQPAGDAGVPFNPSIPPEFTLLSPFHGKYVDANFQPLEVSRIHNALASVAPPATDLELIVAKRIPFRIAMRMSEKAIPDFIAACGNSPFEFEIAQLRINRHENTDGAQSAGGTTSGSPFRQGGGETELNATRRAGSKAPEVRVNDDVDVEFYGIVRIYNPVDEARIYAIAGIEPAAAN